MRVSLADPPRFTALLAERYDITDPLPKIGGVSIDSRRIAPGDLFIPIVGSRVDGHDFIAPAVAAGASAVLVEHDVPPPPDGTCLIRVEHTVRELGALSKAWRDLFSPSVVAITGSNGKTTTKDMAAAVCGKKFRLLSAEASLNSTIGLPLTLLRIGADHQLVVLELGSNRPGEIAYLAGLAHPDIGLITNVSATHVAHLEDQQGVIREKAALFQALPADGAALVNLDDPALAALATPARRITFSSLGDADVTGHYQDGHPGGSLVLDDGLEIHLSQPGAHLAQNALAAVALGVHLDVPREDIKAALEAFVPPAGRGELLRLNGITVIDDSYNANLASTLAGLRTLLQVPSTGRRIVVLGDMLELGRFSQEHHRQVGVFAARHGIDALLCYGPETRETYCTALEGGVDARHFNERSQLAHVLSESVAAGDVVYVKGSRGMAMESVISEAFPP